MLNGNIGKLQPAKNHCIRIELIIQLGVMKSTMGELTDHTNRADAFALMPALWAFGATMGYGFYENTRGQS